MSPTTNVWISSRWLPLSTRSPRELSLRVQSQTRSLNVTICLVVELMYWELWLTAVCEWASQSVSQSVSYFIDRCVCVCVCVCVCERELGSRLVNQSMCVCVCVWVCESVRQSVRQSVGYLVDRSLCVCARARTCVCVCVERGGGSEGGRWNQTFRQIITKTLKEENTIKTVTVCQHRVTIIWYCDSFSMLYYSTVVL